MKPILSPQDQGRDEEVIDLLKRLRSLDVEYPAELFAVRRSAFIWQVKLHDQGWAGQELPLHDPFFQTLEKLKSVNLEYPHALRAPRRTAFIAQIEQHRQTLSTEELLPEDQEIIRLFKKLKSTAAEYPPNLMAARRAAFKRQIALDGQISVLDTLLTSMRRLLSYRLLLPSMPSLSTMRTSLVVLALMLATFVGSLLGNPAQSLHPTSSPGGFSEPGDAFTATSVARVICEPGYFPPTCLEQQIGKSEDLTFPGNGSARPAVAKDALVSDDGVHKAAYVNDGRYGSGTSWISQSAYSWIKIDLGQVTTINTIAFGRDRLGSSNDRNPGQFVIAVALADNVYADGNSNNDYVEYTDVYNSQHAGFNGVVSGQETILAQFRPVTARYIKITFANPGTAVDEVEAFMVQPPIMAGEPTKKPNENPPGISPASIPSVTAAPTGIAAMPTDTAVPVPPDTSTPVPADTATPAPTDTPIPPPPPTDTPLPPPTDPPPATDTPAPAPTNIIVPPAPTDTAAPPAAAAPVPTDTPAPMANRIQPTNTPAPPTDGQPANNPTATSAPVEP